MSGVVSVGVAVAATTFAAVDVAATVGGIAAITMTTAFEVVGAVGAVLGAVGAVTKTPGLMYAGMAIGAVGGLGSLASSAGMFAGAAAGAPDAALGAGAAATGGTDAATWGAQGAMAAAPTSTEAVTGVGLINAGGIPGDYNMPTGAQPFPPSDASAALNASVEITPGPGTTTPTVSSASLGNSPASGVVDGIVDASGNPYPSSVPSAQAPVTMGSGEPGAGVPGGSPATQMGYGGTAATGTGDATTAAAATTTPSATTPPAATPKEPLTISGNLSTPPSATGDVAVTPIEKTTWAKISDWVGRNQQLVGSAVNTAGGFLKGAFDTTTPSKIAAQNAQTASSLAAARLADTQTDLLARQLANTTAPIPIAVRRVA